MSEFSFQPISGFDLPRFAGVPTFMRLPHLKPGDAHYNEVDIGLVGVPWDGGTTNRPGARHGPRQLRDYSTMIRAVHPVSLTKPFELCNCADLGDVPPNPADLMASLNRVSEFYSELQANGITPLTAGGDHLISLPILRGLAQNGPLGMIHFDAHTDLFNEYFGGTKYTHGTPFRRAIEEGLLDPKRVVQIGIRGTMYDSEDIEFGRANGVTIIGVDEMLDRGVADVMQQARQVVGNQDTYISFDIDFIDPAFAPGTGTPEIGGPDTNMAQRFVRELEGVKMVGADLVEVSPPFDPSGYTALAGATMMFEMLCVMSEGVSKSKSG